MKVDLAANMKQSSGLSNSLTVANGVPGAFTPDPATNIAEKKVYMDGPVLGQFVCAFGAFG